MSLAATAAASATIAEEPAELQRLLLLRAVFGQLSHRLRGGDELSQARTAALHYFAALQDIEVDLSSMGLAALLCSLHGLLSGSLASSTYRGGGAAVKAPGNGSKLFPVSTHHKNIAGALDDITQSIYLNEALDPMDRVALTYYELLRIHPFEDGNGRLARLFCSYACKHLLHTPQIVDITFAMRSQMRPYNMLLRVDRSAIVYSKWVSLFTGFIRNEIILTERLKVAVSNLHDNDANVFAMMISTCVGAIADKGHHFDKVMSCQAAKAPPAMRAILCAALS